MIYLDYNATTPVDPRVTEAMRPFLAEHFGNPSSTHRFGLTAKAAIEHARYQVATCIGAQPKEVIFTGGGTEATNLAIKGFIWPLLFGTTATAGCMTGTLHGKRICRVRSFFGKTAGNIHILTSTIEHPATLRCCQALQQLGCKISYVPVDRFGIVRLDEMKKALASGANLVSIMHSNNEVGTLQPIREIADLTHQHGAILHVDAAQSIGKIPVDVSELQVDMLTIAGHKLYAPKGVGALFVRQEKNIALEPVLHGAGHEHGLRAGTENTPYIVGLGLACELAKKDLQPEALKSLRDRLWHGLSERLKDRIVLNGHEELRLPNTLNVSFLGHIGSELLAKVPEIAASTGSACHEGTVHISPVLKAMGIPEQIAQGAVRLTVGRGTTMEEVDRAVQLIFEHV